MHVIVNDQPTEIAEDASVATLVQQLNLPGTRVAVEVNRVLVRRIHHETTRLQPGDVVEVVTLVGGG